MNPLHAEWVIFENACFREKQYCMINGTVEHQSLEVSRFITAGGEEEGVGEIM